MPEYNDRYTSGENRRDKLYSRGQDSYNQMGDYQYNDYDGYIPEEEKDSGASKSGGFKKKFFNLPLIAVQSISCVVIVLIVFLLKSIGGNAFIQVKNSFNEFIMKNSVVSTIATWFDLNEEDQDRQGDEETGATETPTVSTESTAPQATSPSENDVNPSVKTDDQQPASSTTKPSSNMVDGAKPVFNPSNSTDVKPADVKLTGGRVVFAPPGATFAPLRINVKAKLPVEIGEISSGFEYRINPFNSEDEEFHKGLDFAAPEGTSIYAIYFGVVAETGDSPSYGKYVIMDHGNGLRTLYAHCFKVLVEKDKVIKAGEKIAEVGTTGKSTGNHLHLEVILNGVNYDPAYVVNVGELKPLKAETTTTTSS